MIDINSELLSNDRLTYQLGTIYLWKTTLFISDIESSTVLDISEDVASDHKWKLQKFAV